MSLNERQQKFCEFYAKSGNATEAYRNAGYSAKSEASLGVSAHKLLKNAKIAEELAKLSDKTRTSAIASITDIKEFWTKVLESKSEEMPYRLKASELLVKSEGGFLDKVEHSGTTVQRVINVNPTKKKEKK